MENLWAVRKGLAAPKNPAPLSAFGLNIRPFGIATNEESWVRPWTAVRR